MTKNIIVFVDGVPHMLVPVTGAAMSAQTPIEDVFPVRTWNRLRNDGIRYLEELLFKSELEILRIPNMGRKSLHEINDELEKRYGMHAGHLNPPRRE